MTLDFLDDTQVEYEDAIQQTGFGKFHFCLLAVCGMIYLNTAIGITILSFVLPSATCDFQMTSEDKGWLTATPMLGAHGAVFNALRFRVCFPFAGMVLGSYFWGCLADTKGRKYVLISALLLDGVCGLFSSVAQHYWLFLCFRFFNGFGVTGAMGICFPYLGEFQPTKYREKILCWMEIFWTLGIIALPLIAWVVIPQTFEVKNQYFRFHSWNLFVAICAIPSLVIGLWLFAFPESPKFLIEVGETDEALEVLRHIFHKNTGRPEAEYPIKSLKEREREKALAYVPSLRSLSMRQPKHLQILLNEIWEQTKMLCREPYLSRTVLTCAIQFGLTASYYTLMIWFPELFYRFEEYEQAHAGEDASVCIVSSIAVGNGTDAGFCGDPIDSTVYWHTVIIGLACIPTSLILPACIHRLGAKFFIIFSLFIAGGVTFGLYYVTSSLGNLLLSCIFEALTSLGISTIYCVMVDLFPTNLRVMAAALSLTFGRGGALLGNLLFGFLIDLNCVVPIVIFSALLFFSGILCFFLPSTGREALD